MNTVEKKLHILTSEQLEDIEVSTEVWLQDLPASKEQLLAQEVMQELQLDSMSSEDLSPEVLQNIQKTIIQEGRHKVGLWGVAHEVVKKMFDSEFAQKGETVETRRLLQQIIGFHSFRISTESGEDRDIAHRINGREVAILNLVQEVGREQVVSYLEQIQAMWENVQDLSELFVSESSANLYEPDIAMIDAVRSMRLFLQNNPNKPYAYNVLITKKYLDMIEQGENPWVDDEDLPEPYQQYKERLHEQLRSLYPQYKSAMQKFVEQASIATEGGLESKEFSPTIVRVGLVHEDGAVEDEATQERIRTSMEQSLSSDSRYATALQYFNTIQEAIRSFEVLVDQGNFDELPDVLTMTSKDQNISSEQLLADVRALCGLIQSINKQRKYEPLLVVLNTDESIDDDLFEQGVDVVIRQATYHRMAVQIDRAGEMIEERQFISNIQLIQEKQEFYDAVADVIAQRQEVTADTNQELALLRSLITERFGHESIDVLDMGCGYGRISLPLARDGHRVTGVDLSDKLLTMFEESLDREEDELSVDLRQADFADIDVPAESQDIVMMNWHVFCDLRTTESKMEALQEVHRVLREKGTLLLDIPDRSQLEEFSDGYYVNKPEGKEVVYRGYIPDKTEMQEWLYDTGFADIQITSWQTMSGYPKLTISVQK